MLLKVQQEIDRCHRVMRERVKPHVHEVLSTCRVSAIKNPGEPEPSDEFLQKVRNGEIRFEPLQVGEPWGTSWGTTWMKVEGRVPSPMSHNRPIELLAHLGWLDWPVGGHIEAMAYRADGSVIKAVHPQNYWIPLVDGEGKADSVVNEDGTFTLFLEGAYNPNVPGFSKTELGTRPTGKADERYEFESVDVTALNREMLGYLMDLDVVCGAVEQFDSGDPRYWKLAKAMQRSLNAWDEKHPETLQSARKALSGVLSQPANASAMKLTSMGHAHIDSAWLWPVRETKRKVARTVSNVLALMDEDPDFVYVMSSAQQYAWLEQYHPDLFVRVQQRVKEGRFIPVGGMWVESDGMMPSGESLIRQISFGNRYFKEKLGVRPHGVWLPDSFGYTGSWPQIAKRSGYSWFLTQKLSWNDTTRLPHHSFMWEGIDGSQIFTHFPPADKYDSDVSVKDMAYIQRNFKDKDLSDRGILLFGYGDGGGGPTREMTLRQKRVRVFEGLPKVSYGTPDEFFATAHSEMQTEAGDEMPIWKGELYLEKHRKTLTSQQEMKRGCRKEESLLRTLEYLGAEATVKNSEYHYPYKEIDRIWQTLLLNQFHDILPGSAIEWACRVAREEYARDCRRLPVLIDDAIGAIAQVSEDAERLPEAFISQYAVDGNSWKPQPVLVDVSPVGLVKHADGSVTLDNDKLRVHIAADGTVRSIVDLGRRREMVPEGTALGRYEILKDEPDMYDAWDIDRDAFLEASALEEGHITDIVRGDDGSVKVCVNNRYEESIIATSITLRPSQCQLDFHICVDWHAREKLLKVDVPVGVIADTVKYESQYGLVERPVVKSTEREEAMFESCTHRFVQISDASCGVGVVNGSTYGSDVAPLRDAQGVRSGTMLRLSLLSSPNAPDPRTDIGRHEFDWALVCGAGLSSTIGAAGRLNAPVVEGLPESQALLQLDDCEGLPIIDWIKLADDGSGDVVARIYEAAGGMAHATLRTCSDLAGWHVRETNTLEQVEYYDDEPMALQTKESLAAEGAQISLKPFQLCTLRFSK